MNRDDIKVIVLGSVLVLSLAVSVVWTPFVHMFNGWFPPANITVNIVTNGEMCEYLLQQGQYVDWVAVKTDPDCGKPTRRK